MFIGSSIHAGQSLTESPQPTGSGRTMVMGVTKKAQKNRI
jgi:hypothetical protein